MDEPVWLPGVELGLSVWHGQFEDHENTWLRWVDDQGQPISTGTERAERLAAQLQKLGVEPEV